MTPNDEITTAKRQPAKKKAAKKVAKKQAGTAVAIDDPKKRQQLAHAAPQPSDQLLAAIIRASSDPACDPAKMRELIEIKRELDHDAAKAAFDDAFVALQAELPSIRRDRKIEVRKKDARTGERTGEVQQSTPYATFEAIMAEVKPLLTKHGFSLSFETSPLDPIIVGESVMERIRVKGILSRKGHQRTTTFDVRPDNSGSKNPTQAQGSGQSYGKRYCTIALLNIISHAPEDADTDGREGNFAHAKDGNMAETTEVETLTPDELGKLTRKIADCKVPVGQVLKHYNLESVGDLPRSLFATAIKQCDDFAENQRRKAEAARQGFPGDRSRGR